MTSGWVHVKLGKVCEFERNSYKENGTLPYVGLEHIESDTGKFTGSYDPCSVKSNTYKFKPGHILYGRLRPYLNKVVLADFAGHCSTEIFPIKVKEDKATPEYVQKWIMAPWVVDTINKSTTGARMPRANPKNILALTIPIPPLPEQKRIVAILDEAFEAIDQAKANVERNLENAKELFQSKLNAIFSMKGEGWVEKKLGEVCANLDSKRIPITKSKREPGEIPYYGASGIVDYVKDYIFDEDLLLVSEDGANLLARTYPIAFSISGKTWVNNHAHVLRFETFDSQKFIEYYLNSIKLDDFISGMAQPKLNQNKLNSIPVPFPPLEIQARIVNEIDSLSENIFNLRSAYQSNQINLEELKRSILQKAFNGEL